NLVRGPAAGHRARARLVASVDSVRASCPACLACRAFADGVDRRLPAAPARVDASSAHTEGRGGVLRLVALDWAAGGGRPAAQAGCEPGEGVSCRDLPDAHHTDPARARRGETKDRGGSACG